MRYDEAGLAAFVAHQLNFVVPPPSPDLLIYIHEAVQRTDSCLSACGGRYFSREKMFSPYHSVQYGVFLYWLSRVMWERDGNGINAEKVYYLNRILNSVDLFYEVDLPRIWMCEHPLGSIMGRARYSDYFFFYQGCTVGGNRGSYPRIKEYVTMFSNSKILGNAQIGSHVIIGANAYVKDEDIPDNCIVSRESPNLTIKRKPQQEIADILRQIWLTQTAD